MFPFTLLFLNNLCTKAIFDKTLEKTTLNGQLIKLTDQINSMFFLKSHLFLICQTHKLSRECPGDNLAMETLTISLK